MFKTGPVTGPVFVCSSVKIPRNVPIIKGMASEVGEEL